MTTGKFKITRPDDDGFPHILAYDPAAPADVNGADIGRIVHENPDGPFAFQPAELCAWALTPQLMRGLADTLEWYAGRRNA